MSVSGIALSVCIVEERSDEIAMNTRFELGAIINTLGRYIEISLEASCACLIVDNLGSSSNSP